MSDSRLKEAIVNALALRDIYFDPPHEVNYAWPHKVCARIVSRVGGADTVAELFEGGEVAYSQLTVEGHRRSPAHAIVAWIEHHPPPEATPESKRQASLRYLAALATAAPNELDPLARAMSEDPHYDRDDMRRLEEKLIHREKNVTRKP